MKRLLVLLLIVALVGTVSATTVNFQNRDDLTKVKFVNTSSAVTVQWAESTVGGNNYIHLYVMGSDGTFITLPSPYQMQYAGATLLLSDSNYFVGPEIRLYDANFNVLQTYKRNSFTSVPQKYEVKIVGGIPKYYCDGVLYYTGAVITQNPSYIGFGYDQTCGGGCEINQNWDDISWAEPTAVIMGLPESDDNQFIILKDIVNPAASGLWNTTSNTQANANYMTGTWSRGNATIGADVAQPNESIEFKNLGTGVVYATNYTGTGLYGTMAWNVKTMLIDSGAPQGTYGLYRPKTGEYGDSILFKSNGASVAWNADEYSVGDTGTVIYYVLDGGYWDTSLYSYKVSILDSYYQFIQNTSLTSSSGTVDYAWTEDNPEGVYHAWLIATNHDGYEYILGSDYAELVARFGYGGTVLDCITALPISGANVNVSQGMTAIYNGTSGFDGNYTTGPIFSTGSSVFFNVTDSGYNPYQYSFVPLSSGSKYDLNLTICPSAGSGDTGGIGIGGAIRDATIGRPIEGANVSLTNVSNTQQYFKLTNMAGGYLCDNGTSCALVSGRVYAANASKVGYNTSVDYPVTA
jgi:hypothetical protein